MKYADKKFVSNPGNPVHFLRAPKVMPDGNIKLEIIGKEDTDEMIQSYAESCDISVILARASAGDTSVLNQRVGSYGDFTQMPKTFAEMLQLQIDANNMFNSLPVEIKKKFDNDANKFLVQAGTSEWYENVKGVLSDEARSKLFPVVEANNPVESEVK